MSRQSKNVSRNIINKLSLRKRAKRKLLLTALAQAYADWAPRHWEAVDSLFDDRFLSQQALPLFEARLSQSSLPSPAELANLWATQLHWVEADMKQRSMASLLPGITQYLHALAIILQAHAGNRLSATRAEASTS